MPSSVDFCFGVRTVLGREPSEDEARLRAQVADLQRAVDGSPLCPEGPYQMLAAAGRGPPKAIDAGPGATVESLDLCGAAISIKRC